ncbi:hypothetical protein LCGC14_0668670 [marine sediment metagenome]|uniref:Uncharacterized protein n=1 Tax=marine sediment metagenome TaxID=412755 RepID=A0A0F9QRJ1_9ZZZZ
MPVDILVGGTFGAGIGISFLALSEADFAAAAGAAYVPPERGVQRTVAARVVQLLQDSKGIIVTSQTSAGTVRMPCGLTATDDAGPGRFYFFVNSGTGVVTIQDNTGGAIGALNPGNQVFIFHTTNNVWIITIPVGAGMTTTAAQSITVTVTAAVTDYDLFQAGSVTPPVALAPEDLNPLWTPGGYAEVHLEVDLLAMLAGDDAVITIEKQVDGGTWVTLESVTLDGVQDPEVIKFMIETNTGFPIRAGIQRAAGAAYNAEVLFWGKGSSP